MISTELLRFPAAILILVVLLIAAISDVRERRIPNWTVGLVLAVALASAAMSGGLSDMGWAISAGLAMLAVSFALYAIGWIGAGDAKLFAAVAVFTGWGFLGSFVFLTAVGGGVLAILSLAQRPAEVLGAIILQGGKRPSVEIPYGVAIAVGGAGVIWLRAFG